MKVIDLLNKIATMNDYLGEIYSYKDIEDVKQAEQFRKVELMEIAIKGLELKVNQLEEDYKNEVEENLKLSELWRKSQEEKRQLETNRDEAIKELFILKDMIYKSETREENFEIQRKISSILIELGSGKE